MLVWQCKAMLRLETPTNINHMQVATQGQSLDQTEVEQVTGCVELQVHDAMQSRNHA